MVSLFGGRDDGDVELRTRKLMCLRALTRFVGGKQSVLLTAGESVRGKRAKIEIVNHQEDEEDVSLSQLAPLLLGVAACWNQEDQQPTRLAVCAADLFLLLSRSLHAQCWETFILSLCTTLAGWRSSDLMFSASLALLRDAKLPESRAFWTTCVPYLLSVPDRELCSKRQLQRLFERASSAQTWVTFGLAMSLLSPESRSNWLHRGPSLNTRGRLLSGISVAPHVAMALLCEMEPPKVRPLVARVLFVNNEIPECPQLFPSLVRLFFGEAAGEKGDDDFFEQMLLLGGGGEDEGRRRRLDFLVEYLQLHWSKEKASHLLLRISTQSKQQGDAISLLLKPLKHLVAPLLEQMIMAAQEEDTPLLDLWLSIDAYQCWTMLLDVGNDLVLSRLCSRVHSVLAFAPLASALVEKVLARPTNAGLIKVASACSVPLSQCASTAVIPRIVDVMTTQAQLTQQLLDDPHSDAQVQKLLFDRLAPLLLLRTLLRDAYALTGALIPLLIERMENLYEFQEVRRLAAETLAKMEPSLWFTPSLEAFRRGVLCVNREQAAQTVKAVLFSWCGALALHKSAATTDDFFRNGAPEAIRLLKGGRGDYHDVASVEAGAFDFLALCLRFSTGVLRSQFLTLLSSGTQEEARIAAIVIARLCQREKDCAISLAPDAIAPLIKCANQWRNQRAPYLSALFVLVFQSGHVDESVRITLLTLALEACSSSPRTGDAEERMSALKLMGALLGVEGIFTASPEAMLLLPACAASLETIARDPSHPPACKLATQLRRLLETHE